MSRKHYKEVAEIIRDRMDDESLSVVTRVTVSSIARDLASMFKRNNANFDKARFYAACGMEEYQ